MKITVLGAGAWGTTLARLLQRSAHTVALWGYDRQALDDIRQTGRNDRYLSGIDVPREIVLEPELARATAGSECVVIAVPSEGFRDVAQKFDHYDGLIVSVTKGIEYDTGLTMCGILAKAAPRAKCAALSGPSFAIEVAQDVPTAIVASSSDLAVATRVQNLFNRPAFRVYTSADVTGVELGGALKNVIAIAAGVGDGLGFGDNSKAALLTRATAEIRRLGVACGAQAETFTGLSGLGDLMVTCFSRHSRNRAFGERIGRGEKPTEIAAATLSVAEGYPTTRSAYQLARKHGIVTPVIDEVHAMLYENKDVRQAVRDLMTRDLKPED
jgi:glycerol-3-phosphate dehydrogenase (NAD(P)+)